MPHPAPRRSLCLRLLACLAATATALAAYDPGPWPAGAGPAEVGRRVSENFIARPHMLMQPGGVIHYAEVCTWLGALDFADLTRAADLQARLVARFEPLFREEKQLVPSPDHVDYTVFGAVPLELYRQTREPRYLALGEWMALKQWGPPFGHRIEPIAAESIRAGLSWQTRFWIDDMFMITTVQAAAYQATGDRTYLDRAAHEMVAYLDRLQKPNGLFYHTPDTPFYWGRGNGWMAAGTAALLLALPSDHPDRPRILAGYTAMMAALLHHQDAAGLWHQLIDDPTSWPETSSTAMFTFAFITGVSQGWLDAATYGPAARRGWLALIDHLDADANLREICAGTGAENDHQYYLDRPRLTGDFHGQAPVLWCANAWFLLRKNQELKN